MVKTVQVPKLLSDYFRVFEGVERLFETSVSLQAGQTRTEQYRIRNAGILEESRFDTQQDYLRTLNLKVELSRDLEVSIPRISELTLKSNQFNLTTQRYSSGEIESMILSGDYSVYSFNVEDKFGSCGLTGVLITHHETGILRVDTFLMSCRVIGRGVEFSVWNHVFEDAKAKGCTHVEAMYIPTQKNAQVKDFYERLGLEIVSEENNGIKHYRKELEQMKGTNKAWIKVIHA
jgi:FkbH-like protein